MRIPLKTAYTSTMVAFLMRTRQVSQADAEAFVMKVAKSKFKDRKMKYVRTDDQGDSSVVDGSLYKFLESSLPHVLTPNGCVYSCTNVIESPTGQFVKDGLANRSIHKKKMLKARATGDSITERQSAYAQAAIKIKLNALPGGMGSHFNLFYDKGGYNSITSLARSLIATAYTVAEQALGGNYAWFSEEEVINHILINLPHVPTVEETRYITHKYGLELINQTKLSLYLTNAVRPYLPPNNDAHNLQRLISTLSVEACTYLYYLGNLRHLLMDYQARNVALIKSAFDFSKVSVEGIDPNELFKLNEQLMAVVTPQFVDHLNGMQVYDLPTKAPEKAKLYVACVRHLTTVLSQYDELFAVYGYSKTNIPRINIKKNMMRNTVIISDTDSVFITAKDWANWYCGSATVSQEAYQMASLVIYWLAIFGAAELRKWSIKHGSAEDNLGRMNMKTEFMYPSILLYEVKKVYAGIVSINEGVVLAKPKVDIKGGQLRSSTMCKQSVEFISSTVVDHILKPSLVGRISGEHLIKRVVDYENKIRESLNRGETEFLKFISVDNAKEYKKPKASNHMYWVAWEEMFGNERGHIPLPSKASIASIKSPNKPYMSWLNDNHPAIFKRWTNYVTVYSKHPSGFMIELAYNRIPEELIPVLDIRGIIYANIKPVYATLGLLGIPTVHEGQNLLLSDIY
jgi:DNA polymerase elongation subunit (family B)